MFSMIQVPRGVKFLLLAWTLFMPYFAWFFGSLFFGTPVPAHIQAPVFFIYVIVAGAVITVLWRRMTAGQPQERPSLTLQGVPWVLGLTVMGTVVGFILLWTGMAARGASAGCRSATALEPRRAVAGGLAVQRLRPLSHPGGAKPNVSALSP